MIDFSDICDRKKIKSLLGHIADIYNSSEMEGIKAIQHLNSDLKDLTQNADLSSDSVRNIRGMFDVFSENVPENFHTFL